MLKIKAFQNLSRCILFRQIHPVYTKKCRTFTHYPIDDTVFGLTEDQSQLRETIFKFCQKELAPHAYAIDKQNEFPEIHEFWKKLGHLGLLGILASSEYGGSDMSCLGNNCTLNIQNLLDFHDLD